jgi:hypothetical protein
MVSPFRDIAMASGAPSMSERKRSSLSLSASSVSFIRVTSTKPVHMLFAFWTQADR